jgi:hypothetical protein
MRDATLGWLIAGDLRIATLEEPWIPDPDGPGGQRREGALHESCVPDGTYQLLPFDGTRFKGVHALVNHSLGVYYSEADKPAGQKWGRSAILIHNANSTANILGCIAVGLRHGTEQGVPWVYNSVDAFTRLKALLGREKHELIIRPVSGTAERILN